MFVFTPMKSPSGIFQKWIQGCSTLILIFFFSNYSFPEDQKVPPISYDVEVDLVQIVVRVLDKNGKWVSGVQKSDLEILEDGKPQEILYIDEVNPTNPQNTVQIPAERIPVQLRSSTVILLVFDLCNSSQKGIEKNLQPLQELLNKYNVPDVRLGVVAINSTCEYEVIQEFTQEKQDILQAIKGLRGGFQGEEDRSAKMNSLSDTNRLDMCASFLTMGISPVNCIESAYRQVVNKATTFAVEDQVRSQSAMRSLRSLFKHLTSIPGHKNLILISEGMDPGGAKYFNYAADVIRYFAEIYNLPVNPEIIIAEVKTEANRQGSKQSEFKDLIQMANESEVTLYWVNPNLSSRAGNISADVRYPGSLGFNSFGSANIDTMMRAIAEDTGGSALASSDAAKFYSNLSENIPRYYIVSYRPSRKGGDGKLHSIQVKAKRPEIQATSRRDFKDLSIQERTRLMTGQAHQLPETASDFAVESQVHYFKKSKDKYHLTIHAAYPYSEIQPQNEGSNVAADIHFSFIVRDQAGKVVLNRTPIIQVRTPLEELEELSKNESLLEYIQNCELEPGRYNLSIAVVDSSADRSGSKSHAIDLPVKEDGCFELSPAMLASTVSQMSKTAKEPMPKENGHIEYGDKNYQFGIKRLFPQQGSLAGFYEIYNSKLPSVFVSFKLYGASNNLINGTPEHEIKQYTDDKQKLISNFFSVPYRNLPPGKYIFEISARDTGSCKASSQVSFEVVPATESAAIN